MPRANSQNIPPALSALYAHAMAPTRAVAHPGGRLPNLLQSVQGHYPNHIVQHQPPSAAQLTQRQAFRDSATCFDGAPLNERQAYYRLSLSVGLEYYQYYQHRNVSAFRSGMTCPLISRPHAAAFNGDGPAPWGQVRLDFNQYGSVYFHWEATLDPAAYAAHYPLSLPQPYVVEHWIYVDDEIPPYWLLTFAQGYDAAARYTISGSHTMTGGYYSTRFVAFRRNAAALSETVLWQFAVDGVSTTPTYDNWQHE